MPKRLTVLFAPIDAVGHVNSCTGIAEVLQRRGHRIVFAVSQHWSGKLKKYGFEEELFTDKDANPSIDPERHWGSLLNKWELLVASTAEETMKVWSTQAMPYLVRKVREYDDMAREVVNRVKPDLIIVDHIICTPSYELCGIPWILSISTNPLLVVEDERTPPGSSGNKFSNI